MLPSPLSDELRADARQLRDLSTPRNQIYSPKVFIPLTRLRRDYRHYCSFGLSSV